MAIFKGAGVAIVTPMYEDGKVNYDKLEELLEQQIAGGTDAVIICGTTGEVFHHDTWRALKDHQVCYRQSGRTYSGDRRYWFQLYRDCHYAVQGGCFLWS